MKCIGEDLIHLDYFKGFCSQFSTAIAVCFGSKLGFPLSTTHCIVGAMAGVYLSGKLEAMKQVYYTDSNIKKLDANGNPVKDESSKMNFKTLKKILIWWSITVPTAISFAALICFILIKIK
jgi:phosphate/sulfate permease